MHRTGLNVPIWNESRRLRYRFVPFFFVFFPFITNKLHPSNTNPPRQAMEHAAALVSGLKYSSVAAAG